MGFEAVLRTHLEQLARLERVRRGSVFYRVDEHALRAHLLERLEALEATSAADANVEALFRTWSPWISQLARYIANLPASAALDSAARVQEFAECVLDAAMRLLPVELTERVERLEWERIAAEFHTLSKMDLAGVERYAVETYLVRDEPVAGPRPTALAAAFLRLRGKDAIRWLITSELLQSTGRSDPWRTPRELLEKALDERGITRRLDDDGLSMPFDRGLLVRLHRLGVLHAFGDDQGIDMYRAADDWRDAIRMILGTSPWHQAIAAILVEDRTGIAPATRVAAEDVAEQAKMIAHEVRNALIPARIQLEALRSAVPAPQAARLEAAKRGVARVLTFVEEMLATSELVAEQETSCEVAVLVREAIRSLDGGARIDVGSSTSLARVRVPRTRLVRAISNVLRNALQSTAETQPIELSTAQLGATVRIIVDDSGPGVPEDARERIFLDGYTTRTDGTGYGLAYVRRVVADGIRGRVWCEGSHLGGARFVIELPGIETAP